MYEYKTEILRTGIKLFSDKASEGDASQFNEVFNQQAEEGWELNAYTYMAEVFGVRGALLVTYRKLK